VIKSLQDQQDWDITVGGKEISIRGPEGSTTYRETDRERYVVGYVVVSRSRAPHGNCVTMCYGNHGRAIERMGYLFTSEADLNNLFNEHPGLSAVVESLASFQLLFEVRIDDQEREAGQYRLLDIRLYV